MRYTQIEKGIQKELCRYVSLRYPKAIFKSDLSGLRLPIKTATELKKLRSSNGFPDFELLEPTKDFHGLFIEIKAENNSPYNKTNGLLKKDKHLQEQQAMINSLVKRGYCAMFGIGLHECIDIVDNYLK